MNDLILFQFENRPLRIERDEHGEPLFHANDLCALCEYANPRDALRRHVEPDDVVKRDIIDSMGRTQMANWVREPGMWALLLGSETATAKRAKRWLTAEVLPSIRKTGGYGQTELAPSEKILLLGQIIDLQQKLIEQLRQPRIAMPGTGRNRYWTPEEDAIAQEMRAQGFGRHRIGRRLGRSPESVGHRLRRLGGAS